MHAGAAAADNEIPTAQTTRSRPRSRRRLGRLFLIALALAFLAIFLVLPLLTVFTQALAKGASAYLTAISDPMTWPHSS